MPPSQIERQRRVNEHFQKSSKYWRDVYAGESTWATIIRERRDFSLVWVDDLGLARGTRILEVGCGAGSLAAALAQRGYRVDAIDPSEEMVRLTREHVEELGLGGRVAVVQGDVHELSFGDDFFDLVVALGVIPWLHTPSQGMGEMARVIRPGGHLIFTSDNRAAAHHLLDPRLSPALLPIKQATKRLLQRTISWQRPESTRTYYVGFVYQAVSQANLEMLRIKAIGFGPFSFLGRELLPQRAAIRVHHFLQRLADRQFALIQSVGGQHLVLARKPPTIPGSARRSASRA